MINKILKYIIQNKLIPEKSKIVLGLSGGPDSIFLLYLFKHLQEHINFEFITAHLDHEWRKDSHLDTNFCKKISENLGITFFHNKISELDLKRKFNGSKEELGRIMRRFFLEKIAKEQNANLIALAHHLQDQEETFFIRLIRGTTLSGLISIKPLSEIYIRPLLETDKSDILNYLETNKIPYLTDPSNESSDFLRNRIRKNVIPALKECDQRFDDNFLRSLNKLKETEEFIEKLTQEEFAKITEYSSKSYKIDLNKFFELDSFLQNRLIFYWLYKSKVNFELSEKFINEILRFLKRKGSGTHNIHHEWSIEKKKETAEIVHLK